MRLQHQNLSIANYYIGVLNNLGNESKLDLIAQLTQSLKESYHDKENQDLKSLFGAYQGEESAEDIIKMIRTSRVFNRNIEPL